MNAKTQPKTPAVSAKVVAEKPAVPATVAAVKQAVAPKSPVQKAAPASAAKPAAKPVPKAPAAAAKKPAAKPVVAAAKVPVAKSAKPVKAAVQPEPAKPAKAEKAPKPRKMKLVRASYTIPDVEYEALSALKARIAKLGTDSKKSELLRAGLALLAKLDDKTLQAAIAQVEVIKTGRKVKSK